jgi:hypothetical protein
MSPELAAGVIEAELGGRPHEVFLEWDPEPIAAASIGQVHRALVVDPDSGEQHAVAVKVQYPGVDEAIVADLRNADMLGMILKQGFGGLEPDEMVAEIKERLTEELDYRREARNQPSSPTSTATTRTSTCPPSSPSCRPGVCSPPSSSTATRWDELLTWDQRERDLAGETIFRFVFRSLYRMSAFNGDPHPGNYLFHGDGRVTFLDFGLVKHFTDEEITTFKAMVKSAAVDHDAAEFRRSSSAPACSARTRRRPPRRSASTSRTSTTRPLDREMTWSGEYASSIVRHTFDRSSPISQYATVPKAFVFIQRINLGLYALLGELKAHRQLPPHRRGAVAVRRRSALHRPRSRRGRAGPSPCS